VAPLTSLSALQDAVNALPTVAPGKLRVFRGQATTYSTITPAAFRPQFASPAVWHYYSLFLLRDINKDLAARHPMSQEFSILTLWLQALAQHYGTGSQYLDVTHSIESAAWFALHLGKPVTESVWLDSTGPEWRFPFTRNWYEYSRNPGRGYVYAFDVDPWNPSDSIPAALALVDLKNAPEPFKTPRMLAQLGCLIRTAESDKFDLLRHRVDRTPIEVAWPMTGSQFVQRSVEDMFPEPARDSWYRSFLSVPVTADVDADGDMVLKRGLSVTLYRGETPAYNSALTATERMLNPPLLHPVLQRVAVPADADKRDHLQEVLMSGATPVVLEAPLLHTLPAAGSDLWNHELLFSDFSDSVRVYSDTMQQDGTASLRNILFQFSSLEEIFWGREATPQETQKMPRGLWLVRQGQHLIATRLVQDFPDTQLQIGLAVRIELRLVQSSAKTRIIYKLADNDAPWAELSTVPELAKPIFAALYLLRNLSPALKVEASPNLSVSWNGPDEAQHHRYLPIVSADAARLVRRKGSAGVADWFFLRDARNDPFATPKNAGQQITFETTQAYADIPASYFREQIAAARSRFASP